MDLYILDNDFGRKEIIEGFESEIWTERYSASGDVLIKTPNTSAFKTMLVEGAYVGCSESDEVGIIETVLTKDGLIEAKGPFLTNFLKHRYVRYTRDASVQSQEITSIPGYALATLIADNILAGGANLGTGTPNNPAGAADAIDDLSIVFPYTGSTETYTVPFADLYSAIKTICDASNFGFRLYPDSIAPGATTFIIEIYEGRDLTRAQSTYPTVVFSSVLDSLTDVSELRSIAAYKNVCYAYTPNCDATALGASTYIIGLAEVDGGFATRNFDRRTMTINCDDITPDSVGSDYTKLQPTLNRRAKDALINNNYIRMLDGKIVPQGLYSYGPDYTLGDIVELDSSSGMHTYARVTEYIRSKDASGEISYPTLSVV